MDRRRTAWGVTLALTAVGGLVAHLLSYSLLMPGGAPGAGAHGMAGHRHGVTQAATSSASGQHLRVCLVICLAIALLGLIVASLERGRARSRVSVPLWLFAAVPPLGFVVQEQLEGVLPIGALSHGPALDGAFALGLVIQIPVALIAFFAARALLAAAHALVRRLGVLELPRVAAPELWLRPVQLAPAARPSPLARGFGQRAPPR